MENIILALDIMWKGMLGIFAFMALFYGIVTGLDKFFIKKNKVQK